MSDRNLIHQLSELRSVKSAPAVWRAQTRERLLATAESTSLKPFTFADRLHLGAERMQLAVAPLRLVPSVVVLAGLLLGYAPLASATAASLPGQALYGVKRAAESIELSLKPSPAAQGMFRLELAGRRLEESMRLSERPAGQAELLREYNIQLAFAEANLQAAQVTSQLAQMYDQEAHNFLDELQTVPVTPQTREPRQVALSLTNKLGSEALALLVGAHVSGQNGVASAAVAERLAREVAKLEAKLGVVEVKISEFPETKPAPQVVLEKKVAIVPAREASRQAKESLTEAKNLIEKNQFGLALEKLEESEEITEKTEAAVTVEEEASPIEGEEPASGESKVVPEGEVQGESTETQPESTEQSAPADGMVPVPEVQP